MKSNQSGFTLIELVVVIGVLTIISGTALFNLIRTQKTSEVNSIADTIVSDIASQQTKAMMGQGSSSGTNYGIHFDQNKYVLFKGNTYLSSDPNNTTETLDSGYIISNILFTGGDLIFNYSTGTVSGFLNNKNSISVSDTQAAKTINITVNKYGVVTGEN